MTMVVIYTPTPSRCQKIIKNLNNIIIIQLPTKKGPSIESNSQKFNISADQNTSKEEFNMSLANLLFNAILVTVDMHVITNQGYPEDGLICFTKISNYSIKESNKMVVRLDIAAVIPKTNSQKIYHI